MCRLFQIQKSKDLYCNLHETVTVNEQVAWFPEVSRASYAISVSPNGNVPTPAWSHSGHCNPEHVKSTETSPTLSVIVGGRQLNDP